MCNPKIVVLNQQKSQPVFDCPRPDRLISGNPRRQTWEQFVNHSGELSCGIWLCEAGSWRIQFTDNKDEFFCVIEGLVRLHDDKGVAAEVRAGEAAIIPAGFSGVFEVVEPVRKYYVVLERGLPV